MCLWLSFSDSQPLVSKFLTTGGPWWLFWLGLAIMPDLGNAAILFLTVVIMIAVSGIGYRWFSTMLSHCQCFRLGSAGIWLNWGWAAKIPVLGMWPLLQCFFSIPSGIVWSGHQLANSYYAMSNGGWFGLGLGNSIESAVSLPEAHTYFCIFYRDRRLILVPVWFWPCSFFLILRIICRDSAKNYSIPWWLGNWRYDTYADPSSISVSFWLGVTFPSYRRGNSLRLAG